MPTRKRRALQQVLDRLESLIARHGVAIVSVGAARDAPAFSYTVGLSDDGLPELLVNYLALKDEACHSTQAASASSRPFSRLRAS